MKMKPRFPLKYPLRSVELKAKESREIERTVAEFLKVQEITVVPTGVSGDVRLRNLTWKEQASAER